MHVHAFMHCRLRSMLPGQGPSGYLAQKHGDVSKAIDAFVAQRRYLEAYLPAIEVFSADDGLESYQWLTQTGEYV